MELDLQQLLRMLKKRWWIILLTVLIVCSLTAVYSFYITKPIYEASSRIIVNMKSPMVENQPINYSELNANIKLIETYKEIIKSSNIMNAVISSHPEFNLTINELISKVNVVSVTDTPVMIITVRDESNDKAVNIANAVVQAFLTKLGSIMSVNNVTVLDEAILDPSPTPVYPDPFLNIFLSLILSVLLSLGYIFVLEYRDDTFSSEEEIEKSLGIPVLGTIKKMKKRNFVMVHAESKTSHSQVGDPLHADSNA
jgi:capsular polysaccharide biosynthesis protein